MRTLLVFLLPILALPALAQDSPQPPPDPDKHPADGQPETRPDPFKDDPRPRVSLKLDDCVRLALEKNLDLEFARLEPRLFEGDLKAFEGAYDPIAYVNGNRRSSKSPSSSTLAGAAIVEDDLWTAAVGFKGTMLLGTTWDLNFVTDRNETNSTFSTLNPRWNSSFGFSLRQPLLRNAWLDYQLISGRITQNAYGSAVKRVEQTTSETIHAVELAYWNLVNAIEQKLVKDRALELAQRLYEVNKNKVKAGALAPIEELRAESEVASRREGIITAKSDIEAAMDELRRLILPIERPGDWDNILVPAEAPEMEPQKADLEASVLEALAARPELAQLKYDLDSSLLDEKRYSRDLLPTFDLTGSLRFAGLGRNFGDSLEGIHTSDFDTWEIGFVFEYPLGTRTARGGLIRSEAATRRAALSLRTQEQAIVLEVRSAAREIDTTAQRIEATGTATRLARRALEAENARYERGLTTSHQLLQFLSDAETAAAAEKKAMVDHRVALLRMRKATGGLLKERAAR
jgi:HAE1 family hydrophobic/amphiphilic exporter-1